MVESKTDRSETAYFNDTPIRVIERRIINDVPAVLVEWPNTDRMWLDPSEVLTAPRSQGETHAA